jgi:hypothetical protein
LVRVPREVGRRVLLRHSDVTVERVAYTISCIHIQAAVHLP